MRKTLKRAYNSKIGKKIRKITGDRYGRGAKQLLIKGVPQLTRDVLMLKKMVNAEKKRIVQNNGGYTVGQCSVNGQGFLAFEVTPVMSQGNTNSTRNGSSIKLNSSYMKLQFLHQSNTTQPIRLKCYLISVPGLPTTNITGFINNMFSANPFITGGTIRDYNSQPNPDFFRQYRIIRKTSVYLPPDNYSGAMSIKDVAIPVKFRNHHVRFNGDTDTITAGQLIFLVMADSGNMGGTTSTLGNIPVTGASTGAILNYNIIHYYYDN